MRYLVAVLQAVVAASFLRRWALVSVWITALLSSFFVVGCGPTIGTEGTIADLMLVKEKLRPLCWEPPEVTAAQANGDNDIFFAFAPTTGEAVTSRDRWVLDQAIFQHGMVFKYAEAAPVENLKLFPFREWVLGVAPAFQAQAGPRTRPSGAQTAGPPARA